MTLEQNTRITWLGHSTFRIESTGGKKILIEPWVMSNPACPDDLKQVDDLDLVLISHGHTDHMGDAVEVLQQSGAIAVGIFDLTTWLGTKGVQNTSGMNKGGTQEVQGIKITATHAVHSSGFLDGDQMVYCGEPLGFVIELEDGFRIYHAGDTALFGDMKLIGELYHPDLVLLPIGDHFTMGPMEAAHAIRLLGVKRVVPMHYGTFPVLTGTPEELRAQAADVEGLEVFELQPGETLEVASGVEAPSIRVLTRSRG